MAKIMIAQKDAAVTVDGVEVEVEGGVSTADSDSRIVQLYPDLWVEFPMVDEDEPPAGTGPSAKDVRAWAKDHGIDVPAKGKLPQDVIARYEAEHGG